MSKEKWNTDRISDQKGRVIIVTGSTSGIGKETARILAQKNAAVILAVRNVEKGEKVAGEIKADTPEADITVGALDLTSLVSINKFADNINETYDRLDTLVNNAGIMLCPFARTQDGFEIQMGTNHLGHFALTGRLMPLLKNTMDSRIVNTSSLGHRGGNIDFSDLNWEKRKYKSGQAYADSKIANLYFTYELTRRHQIDSNVPKTMAAHPGWTRTELQRHSALMRLLNIPFSQGPDMGALPNLRAATDPNAQSGDYFGPSTFFEFHGSPVRVKSNKRSHDEKAAQKLWELSETLTSVSF